MFMVLLVERGERQIVKIHIARNYCYIPSPALWFSATFWDKIGLFLVKLKPSLATSTEFITEWQALHPLPELVDSNSKQEPYPWMRPEAAHCSLEASESESCCQATVYRWRGGGASSGVLYCCPRPCLSLVIVASVLDLQLAWPWIIDLIFFFPKYHGFTTTAILIFLDFFAGQK